MIKIAFDVDGTLIGLGQGLYPEPRWETIAMLKHLSQAGCSITVWSGGGKDWAESIVRRFGLGKYVSKIMDKPKLSQWDRNGYDLCFDDEAVEFAKVNIRIPCLDPVEPIEL